MTDQPGPNRHRPPLWKRRRTWLIAGGSVLGVFVLLIIIGLIVGPRPSKTAATAGTGTTAAPIATTSTTNVAPASTTTTVPPAITTTAAATTTTALAPPTSTQAPAPTQDVAPVQLMCSDVAGVFVPHGTDGRGDCEPANPRPSCHVPPAAQDPNYLAELTMSPPFPGGTVDYPFLIGMASNKDCWKQPAGQ